MNVTAQLVSYILDSRLDDIRRMLRHEAGRALLNIVGCALGGAEHPAMDIAMAALGPTAVRHLRRARTRGTFRSSLLRL